MLGFLSLTQVKAENTENWPQFRGPGASGVSEGVVTPTTWNVPESSNLKWKTPIPGLGHSCPIVWGDRLFLTTAISDKKLDSLKIGIYHEIAPVEKDGVHAWVLYCIDKSTGKVIWERVCHKGVPKDKRHTKSSHSNCTPATDGKRVVSFFGSEGLYCHDFNGALLWKKDFGILDAAFFRVPRAQWGFASSPIIHEGVVLIQCDVLKHSFLAAIELETGKTLWKKPRNDLPAWSSPAVYGEGDKTQVLLNGYRHIGGYDFRTGAELWRFRGGGDIPVPTPVTGHGLAFITNAHGKLAPIYAIKLDSRGDVSLKDGKASSAQVPWSVNRGGAYMQTPIVYGDYFYNCRDNGVLACFEAKTGRLVFQARLGSGFGGFTGSPVASGGKIYYVSEVGEVVVIKAGTPELKILAKNPLGDICLSTPAISDGELFFRTRTQLIAISDK
ncbi:PQQ-like beta-propeller repeat protein [Opitutales bacterium]|nr:PQQ-like beta-propeller repeat protein [Opitutales bacterium]